MIGKNLKKVGLTAILTIGIFALFGCSIKLDVPTKDIEAVKETTMELWQKCLKNTKTGQRY